MATFGEHFLLPFPKARCSLSGVEKFTDSEHVLVTHDQKYIKIYNLTDQKVVEDWTFHDTISCPAVCYGSPQKLATVTNHTLIRNWSRDNINIEKSQKIKTLSPVYRLWSIGDTEEPCIVHKDGSCSSLNDNKVILVKSQIKGGGSILWSDCVSGTNPVLVLVVMEDDRISALGYHWNKDSKTVVCTKQKLSSVGPELVQDYSICLFASAVYLFILRKSKQLDKFCVFSQTNESQSESQQSSIIEDLSECTAISALDIHQVAVGGTVASSGKSGLAIWNTKFGLLQTFYPTSSLIAQSKIYKSGKHLYVSTEDGPVGIPYIPAKTSLVSALGKLQKTPVSLTSSTENNEQSRINKLRSFLVDLIDTNKTPDKKKFTATSKKFLDCLNFSQTEDFFILRNEMSQLMNRLANLTFWPGDSIFIKLVESSALQGRSLLTLMPLLVKHKEVKVLHRLLHSVPDIPESALTLAMDFYLQCFVTTQAEADNDTDGNISSSVKCPYHTGDALYINKLLALPYNDVFLIEHLRNMNFEQVTLLLKYLTYLMTETFSSPEITKDKGLPSLEQVVTWVNIVLDAHFAQIILSPDCRDLVVDLHQIVESQVEFYEELVSLEGLLYQLRERAVIPAQQSVGLYCIQTLHVS